MTARADHERARQLVLDQAIAELGREDARWLDTHLAGCDGCGRYADSTAGAITTLRMASEMPSPAVVRATQRSIRYAARIASDRASQRRMLIMSCILAAGWGTVMQPLVWRLFGWLGEWLSLPDPAWQAAFILTWILPGIVSVLLFTHLPLPSWMRHDPNKEGTL